MIIKRLRALLTLIQLIVTVTFVIILMYIFRKNTKAIRGAWGKLQLKLMGIKLIQKGKIDTTANMVMMNHQSVLDIIVMEAIYPKDLAWVAKKEIGDIPWFGHILKAPDMIMVERESKSSLVKLLRDCKEKYSQNRPIAIFPEGTRTDGTKLRKFKVGAKIIAEKNKMLVQPVVIINTKKIFDSQNFTQQSGTVEIIFLDSVEANKSTNWYKDTELKMKQILDERLKNNAI